MKQNYYIKNYLQVIRYAFEFFVQTFNKYKLKFSQIYLVYPYTYTCMY